MSKKQVPLDLLTAIEKLLVDKIQYLINISEENTYYYLADKEAPEDLYFKIYINGREVLSNFNPQEYVWECKPGIMRLGRHPQHGDTQTLLAAFVKWIEAVEVYNNTLSILDDNFTKEYTDYYYPKIKFTDKEADYYPFNPDQQEKVLLYLDYVKEEITNDISTTNDEKTQLLIAIEEIKEELPNCTKNQTVKKIATVWAKICKVSKPLARKVIDIIIDKGIELILEAGYRAFVSNKV